MYMAAGRRCRNRADEAPFLSERLVPALLRFVMRIGWAGITWSILREAWTGTEAD
jgi:hypothetical protein